MSNIRKQMSWKVVIEKQLKTISGSMILVTTQGYCGNIRKLQDVMWIRHVGVPLMSTNMGTNMVAMEVGQRN